MALLAAPVFAQGPAASPAAPGGGESPQTGLPSTNQAMPELGGSAPAAPAAPAPAAPAAGAPGAPAAGAAPHGANPSLARAPLPSPRAGYFELILDNFGTSVVKAYIDGGLKCTLPTRFHCVLWVPDKELHSVHLLRGDGFAYDDKFQFPIVLSGKSHDGAAYIITDQNVRLELKPTD